MRLLLSYVLVLSAFGCASDSRSTDMPPDSRVRSGQVDCDSGDAMIDLDLAIDPGHTSVLLLLHPWVWPGRDSEDGGYAAKTDLYMRVLDHAGRIVLSEKLPPEGFTIIDFPSEPYDPHDTLNRQHWRLAVEPEYAFIEFIRNTPWGPYRLPIYLSHEGAPVDDMHFRGTPANELGDFAGLRLDIKSMCAGESVLG